MSDNSQKEAKYLVSCPAEKVNKIHERGKQLFHMHLDFLAPSNLLYRLRFSSTIIGFVTSFFNFDDPSFEFTRLVRRATVFTND